MTIRLRAHHLLCMLTYIGRGYSPGFTANYDDIAERLNGGEDIVLVGGPDDICAPLLCLEKPHCHGQSVLHRDDRAAKAVGDLLGRQLSVGSCINLNANLLTRLRQAFAQNTLRQACLGCEWFDLCTTVADKDFQDAKISMTA